MFEALDLHNRWSEFNGLYFSGELYKCHTLFSSIASKPINIQFSAILKSHPYLRQFSINLEVKKINKSFVSRGFRTLWANKTQIVLI